MKIFFLTFVLSINAFAYAPTIESLFRHGSNPDISTNALSVSFKVTPVDIVEGDGVTASKPASPLWVRLIYNINQHGKLKLTQLLYRQQDMTDSSLVDKKFIPDLTPTAFGSSDQADRGLFFSMMNSLLVNDGSFLVEFLRAKGLPVKLNSESMSSEKRALLSRYKAWLGRTNGGRQGTPTDESPLLPSAPADREKVERIMGGAMYDNQGHVTLSRHQGDAAWRVALDGFEAWVGDNDRYIRSMTLKNGADDLEFILSDYILFNGTSSLPKKMKVKAVRGQEWEVDVIGLRSFNESPGELVARLGRHDQVLRVRQEQFTHPSFLY